MQLVKQASLTKDIAVRVKVDSKERIVREVRFLTYHSGFLSLLIVCLKKKIIIIIIIITQLRTKQKRHKTKGEYPGKNGGSARTSYIYVFTPSNINIIAECCMSRALFAG